MIFLSSLFSWLLLSMCLIWVSGSGFGVFRLWVCVISLLECFGLRLLGCSWVMGLKKLIFSLVCFRV